MTNAPEPIDEPVEATDDPPRRTHPITPLIVGWKVLAGLVAVLTAQNLAQLASEFTVRRALLALAALAGVLVIGILLSAVSWWRTTYRITPDGVVLARGVLTLSRRSAPREKIESVSVERPALARALGLAKVRIEIAGGAESHLDIEYVSAADAEQIRTRVLHVAGRHDDAAPGVVPAAAPATGGDDRAGIDAGAWEEAAPAEGTGSGTGRLRSVLVDGVTDGVLIAEIPTSRLLRSLLRDVGFMLALVLGQVWAVVATVFAIMDRGPGFGVLITVVPLLLALPKMVLSRIESGWGFVSRLTGRGLRMRRGLLSTRTDNLAPDRVQDITLSQPLLWRGPGWVAAKATVAGVGSTASDGPTAALPVGTRDELGRTLGHLLPSITHAEPAAAADLEQALRLLQRPARETAGLRTPFAAFWISRRTRVTVPLPGALAIRSGILTRRLTLVPRERIQGVQLAVGPVQRLLGCADVRISVAGATRTLGDLRREEAVDLARQLAADAAAGRHYRDRNAWPQPPLLAAAPLATPEGGPA